MDHICLNGVFFYLHLKSCISKIYYELIFLSVWLETLWTGGSCLLWPASRSKEEILMYEEHDFPAQRGMGVIKVPSGVAFGVIDVNYF